MITCPKCGNVNDDNSNFCNNCGYDLKSAQSVNRDTINNMPEFSADTGEAFVPGQIRGKKKKRSKLLFFIPLLVVIAAAFFAVNVLTRNQKVIDLEKCVDVSFTGYDGDGSAVMSINTTRLTEQIKAAKGKDADKYNADDMTYYIKLDGTVKQHAASSHSDDEEDNGEGSGDEEDIEDKENDLKHLNRGDIITVTIDYGELQKRYNDLEFSGRDKDVEVDEGLKDYKIIDPFIHIEPTFTGTAPFGRADIKSVEDKIPPELIDLDAFNWYQLNKFDEIDIGDTLVLSFTLDGKHDWKEKGLKPAREEMEYTVTEKDLPKFVTRMDEISADDLAKIQAEARDRVVSYMINRYNQKNTEYVGAYLMVPKKGNWDSYSTKSFLYLVFKSQIKKYDDTVKEIWLAVKSSDLRKLKESNESGDLYDPSENNQVFDITRFSSVIEYESEEDLYNNLILGNSIYERNPEYVKAEQGAEQ